MRDYIFRGKHAWDDSYGWVYGSLIKAGTYCCILDPDDEDDMDFPYLDDDLGTIDGKATPVRPETVGEWTGLLDKNGKRIFEGDLVRIWGDPRPLTVKYAPDIDNKWSTLSWTCVTYEHPTYRHRLEANPAKYEVIGNIYDGELKGETQ